MYRIFMVEDDKGILDEVKAKGAKWELKIYGVKTFGKYRRSLPRQSLT